LRNARFLLRGIAVAWIGAPVASPNATQAQTAVVTPLVTLRHRSTLPGENGYVYFAGVADADILPDGSVVVLDALNKTIYRFRPDGAFLDSLGRAGRGPGELEQPTDIEVGPGGEIAVADGTNGRLNLWSADHRLKGAIRFPGWPVGMWWNGSGLYLKTFAFRFPSVPVSFYRVMLATDTVGPPMFTFISEQDPKLRDRGISCEFCPSGVNRVGRPILTSPGSLRYRIIEALEDGKTGRVWMRDGLPAAENSPEELKRIRAGVARAGQRFSPALFKYKPRFAAIALDDRERLWVLRWGPDGEPSPLDLFDREARFITQLSLPTGVRRIVIRGEVLLAIAEVPSGEPVVFVYSVETSGDTR